VHAFQGGEVQASFGSASNIMWDGDGMISTDGSTAKNTFVNGEAHFMVQSSTTQTVTFTAADTSNIFYSIPPTSLSVTFTNIYSFYFLPIDAVDVGDPIVVTVALGACGYTLLKGQATSVTLVASGGVTVMGGGVVNIDPATGTGSVTLISSSSLASLLSLQDSANTGYDVSATSRAVWSGVATTYALYPSPSAAISVSSSYDLSLTVADANGLPSALVNSTLPAIIGIRAIGSSTDPYAYVYLNHRVANQAMINFTLGSSVLPVNLISRTAQSVRLEFVSFHPNLTITPAFMASGVYDFLPGRLVKIMLDSPYKTLSALKNVQLSLYARAYDAYGNIAPEYNGEVFVTAVNIGGAGSCTFKLNTNGATGGIACIDGNCLILLTNSGPAYCLLELRSGVFYSSIPILFQLDKEFCPDYYMANAHWEGPSGMAVYTNTADNIMLAGKSFTITVWIYQTSATGGGGIFSLGSTYAANEYLSVGVDNSGCLRMSFGGGNDLMACSPTPFLFESSVWFPVAFQYDALFGIQTLWHNGFLLSDRFASAFVGRGVAIVASAPLNPVFGSYAGFLDELHVYEKLLSPGEMYSIARYDSYPPPIDQVIWLGFNEGRREMIMRDSSGHNFDFIITTGNKGGAYYQYDACCLPIASMFQILNLPASTPAGSTFNVELAARDPMGKVAPTFQGTPYSGYVGIRCSGSAVCPQRVFFLNSLADFNMSDPVAEVVTVTVVDPFPTHFAIPAPITLTFYVGEWTTVEFVRTPAGSALVGQTATVTLVAKDSYGNVITGTSGNIGVSISGGVIVTPSQVQFIDGYASVQVSGGSAGQYTITTSNPNNIPSLTTFGSGDVYFTNTPTKIHAAYNPPTRTSSCDDPIFLTLTLADASDRPVYAGYNATISVFVSGHGGGVRDARLVDGQVILNLTDRLAETVSVSFTDPYSTGYVLPPSSTLTFVAGAPYKFVVIDPYTLTPGEYGTGKTYGTRIEIQDAWGNLVDMSATATMYLEPASSRATISNAALTFVNGVASSATVSCNSVGLAIIRVLDSSSYGYDTSSAQTVYWNEDTCTTFKVRTPSTTPGSYTLRSLVTVTIECVDSSGMIVDGYNGASCGITSNDPTNLTPTGDACVFSGGLCHIGLKAYRSGTYTVTPVNLAWQGTNKATVGASLTVSVTNPIIWSASMSGCLTSGGCTYHVQGMAFTDLAVCSQAPTLQLKSMVTGFINNCTIVTYNQTDIICTVPYGQGFPEVVVTTCGGLRNSHLPRWPNDVFFWRGSNVPQSIFPYCLNMDDPLDMQTHLWTQAWFCGSAFRDVVDWKYFMPPVYSYNDPVPPWYRQNYRCTQILEPDEWYTNQGFGSFPSNWFCVPGESPYYLTYSRSGVIEGQYCVQLRNDKDPSWVVGDHFLCSPNAVPYGSDTMLQYHYAPPIIHTIIRGNGSESGLVTLIGTSFGYGAASTVTINDDVCEPVLNWNHTHIVCAVPPGLGLNNPLVLTVEGQVSNTVLYDYPPPDISDLLPPNGTTAGGELVTIVGGNFGPCCTGSVTLGGLTCQVSGVANTSWDARKIICLTPAGAGIDQPVYVTIGGQTNAIPALFDYLPPTLYSITPNHYDSQGGITVTITGSSFSLISSTRIGPFYCPPTRSQTHTTIWCQLPPGLGANLSVTVTTSAGQVNDNINPTPPLVEFSYNPPIIDTLSPRGARSGSNVFLTLTGQSFGVSGEVRVGAWVCPTNAGIYQHQTIQCALPIGHGANLPVTVTSGGQMSNVLLFSYSPMIHSVPLVMGLGYTDGGSTIELVGSGFSDPAFTNATVEVGGRNCPIILRNDTNCRCILPQGEGSDVEVQITVGGQASNVATFSYTPPIILTVTPAHGPTSDGTLLTLSGFSFGFGDATRVTLGGETCTIIVATLNATTLQCYTPRGSGAN